MKTLSSVVARNQWGQGTEVLLHSRKACLGMSFCELYDADEPGSWSPAVVRLASIVVRLWPERARGFRPMDWIVAFNDHPETTYSDVQKAAREYDLEVDLHD